MDDGVGDVGLYAGGNSGGDDGDSKWDLRPIYRSLAAAYGWTYGQIDEHTLLEVNDLFAGWNDHPPTNLLVKAIVEGLSGGAPRTTMKTIDIPDDAMKAMQDSAMAAIASKAGGRLPIMRGADKGLPKAAPIFDENAMKRRNAERIRDRALERKR